MVGLFPIAHRLPLVYQPDSCPPTTDSLPSLNLSQAGLPNIIDLLYSVLTNSVAAGLKRVQLCLNLS